MKKWITTIVVALAPLVAGAGEAAAVPYEIGPWRLGMNAGQVASFSKFGPYKIDPESGGIETRNGTFEGKRSTISFNFEAGALSTIQVWKYEGSDPAAAKEAILDVYRLFATRFGGATIDGADVDGKTELSEDVLKAVVDSTIDGSIKSAAGFRKEQPNANLAATFDMRPVRQPSGSRLQLRWRYTSKYNSLYVVFYQDRVDSALRTAPAAIEVSVE